MKSIFHKIGIWSINKSISITIKNSWAYLSIVLQNYKITCKACWMLKGKYSIRRHSS